MLFRQIRLITGKTGKFNPYVIFVDCKGVSKKEEPIREIILNGFIVNGVKYLMSEKSASMTRDSTLSFVREQIESELSERVSMGVDVGKTVLSKYYAYKGLMLSSCHCIEDWVPKIIVVPDYYRIIPNQRIKYIYDKQSTYKDKEGIEREWTQKDVAETTRDIEINAFDGCGIHHPLITSQVQELLSSRTSPTSILLRFPFCKGVTHEVDYIKFFADRGIKSIKDLWGVEHSVEADSPPMIILTESMYKGYKYFKNTGGAEDWDDYWKRFYKYEHCIGIAKWNYSLEEEPAYSRANYQILQDLKLPYNDFRTLADTSVDWVEKIMRGDKFYTYCFLGLMADRHKTINDYGKAILKNPEMLKETGVKNDLCHLIKKYRDEMKCGKLWVKGSFKFLAPDLIMLMEHIAGLPPNGCLEETEFYSRNIDGDILGDRMVERNPHICHSEHAILTGVSNSLIRDYLPNLTNVCMINCKSIVPQKINGADFDGDLILLLDNPVFMSGVSRNVATVIDIDDKITVTGDIDNSENRAVVTMRNMKNLIGEYSNYASVYHNKIPKTSEQADKYENYINVISTIVGKSIDFSKTGILYLMPRYITKFGRPLPYFMKYRSPYYARQKLSLANSNMNRLCRELEKWEKPLKWNRDKSGFDYRIMIDDTVLVDAKHYEQINDLYLEFCKKTKELSQLQWQSQNYDRYKDALKGMLTREEAKSFEVNWGQHYENYKSQCATVCKNPQELANIAVSLCYEKYKSKSRKFMWVVASDGILLNIKQVETELPVRDINGQYEYLGRKYSMRKPIVEGNDFND